MTPEVKALVEAALHANAVLYAIHHTIGGLLNKEVRDDISEVQKNLEAAMCAVEALDTPAARHQAALDRGAEWDGDFGQQDIQMGR